MYVRDVTLADFDAQVVAASHRQPVVIDFWALWCGWRYGVSIELFGKEVDARS